MTHVHRLSGCRPEPLGSYLKALGILHLLAEQVDPGARGWWRDETFWLATSLSREALERFFLEQYSPSPIVSPWNGGSGFYPNDQKSGVDAIAASTSERFSDYRAAIASGRALTEGWQKSPKEGPKQQLLRVCRQMWRGRLLRWLDAAIVIEAEGTLAYPALLGTGGSDGRLDFTNNLMQRLAELFALETPGATAVPVATPLLRAAMFGDSTSALRSVAIGQFQPGGAGGANAASGFGGESLVNVWDFVLMLEGSLVFRSGLSRRTRNHGLPKAAAPFAVYPAASGYASAATGEQAQRGEQWMPLWVHPATASAVDAMVTEGRAEIGVRPAERAVDFARAIARLGVARGIGAFTRFAFLERNGQANLAIGVGTWSVSAQPHVELIDEVAPWLDAFTRAAADKVAPRAFGRLARACESAVMECCRRGDDPRRWQTFIIALGEAEAAIPRSPRFAVEKRMRPLPPLSASWVEAMHDESPELRLALAFAGQACGPTGSVRDYFLPLDGRGFAAGTDRLRDDPAVVCTSGILETDAAALVRRALVEMPRFDSPLFPLRTPTTGAWVADISAFLAGVTDDSRILALSRGLMAVRQQGSIPTPGRRERMDGMFAVLRLAYAPHALRQSRDAPPTEIPADPAIAARLVAGDLSGAVATAARRLAAHGLRPRLEIGVGDSRLARRFAAALAFPLAWTTYQHLLTDVTSPPSDDPSS